MDIWKTKKNLDLDKNYRAQIGPLILWLRRHFDEIHIAVEHAEDETFESEAFSFFVIYESAKELLAFEKIETPINYVIKSNFGQQMSIFGSDPDVIADLIDPLVNQVCRVNINCQCQRGPDTFLFTGRKDSAEGTLSVSEALNVFSIETLVAAKDIAVNKNIITNIVRSRKSTFLSTDYIF